MKNELRFRCPCGYGFEMFGIANDAISMIKLHFESFHKHYLPFGITNDEARKLLKEGHEEIKPKISKRTANSAQTKPNYSSKNSTPTLQSLLDKLLGDDIDTDIEEQRKKRLTPISML